jgi:hypothetical protein
MNGFLKDKNNILILMNDQEGKDYKICFAGATISKVEAKRIGFSFILGFFLVLLINSVINSDNKYIITLVCFVSVFFSYFVVSKGIFKNKYNKNK